MPRRPLGKLPESKGWKQADESRGRVTFSLGRVVMTAGVSDLIAEDTEFAKFVHNSLRRHASGDWGDLSAGDKKQNDEALKPEIKLRLFSAYENRHKIWIITERDRSATTILFPSEY